MKRSSFSGCMADTRSDYGACRRHAARCHQSRECHHRSSRRGIGRRGQWCRRRRAGNRGRGTERSQQWKPLDARRRAHARRSRCGGTGRVADRARRWGHRARGAAADAPAGGHFDRRRTAFGTDPLDRLGGPPFNATVDLDGLEGHPDAVEICAQGGEVGTQGGEVGGTQGVEVGGTQGVAQTFAAEFITSPPHSPSTATARWT